MKKFLSVLLITIITILSFPVTEYADENSNIYVTKPGTSYKDYGYDVSISIDDGSAGIDIIKYRPGDAFNETLDYATFYFSTKKRYISNILINGTSIYSCNLSYLEVEKGNHKKIKVKDLNLNTGDQLNLNYDSDSKEYKGSIKCFKVKANNRKIDISIKTSKAMIQVTNVTRDINKVVVPTSKTNYFTTPKWKVKGKYKNYSKKSKYTGTYCLFTWKKAKLNKLGKSAGVKFKGYEVYRRENAKYWYENGKKKYAWTKVKTVKKKKYVIVDGRKSDLRIKVRAYGVDNYGNKIYGKFSRILIKKDFKGAYKLKKKSLETSFKYDKFASEDAFNYQNKLRKKNGKKELIWSDVMYNLCQKRTERKLGYKDAHDYFIGDAEEILGTDTIFENSENGFLSDTGESCVDAWYDEKGGHTKNMLDKRWVYGAICFRKYNSGMTYATYVDEKASILINKKSNLKVELVEAEW